MTDRPKDLSRGLGAGCDRYEHKRRKDSNSEEQTRLKEWKKCASHFHFDQE